MAIANELLTNNNLQFDDTITIHFANSDSLSTIKFSRVSDVGTITIPQTYFLLNGAFPLKSTTQIPDKYLPSEPSTSWIVVNSTDGYASCNITIDSTGISIYNGILPGTFTANQLYHTMNSQVISYIC